MDKTIILTVMTLGAAALMLCGCSKENTDGGNSVLNFSSDDFGVEVTKGEPTYSVRKFKAMGYDSSGQWFPKTGSAPVDVDLDGGNGGTFPDYKWVKDDTKTFFACSDNLPDGTTLSFEGDKLTMSVSAIPTDQEEQEDVVLGVYKGDGNDTGTAALTFYHPFARIKFAFGDRGRIKEVKSITLSGVYSSGSTSIGESGGKSFSWNTSLASTSGVVRGYEENASFFLIPQNLSSHNVMVTLVVDTWQTEDLSLEFIIDNGTWISGNRYKYIIDYDGIKVSAYVYDWINQKFDIVAE